MLLHDETLPRIQPLLHGIQHMSGCLCIRDVPAFALLEAQVAKRARQAL